ncbi:hypothetical protein [Massilia timonae]|uniref:hypothetical protein n=1 Tax=Massilia timonae TaxID=47229 RepID=UPI0028D638BD|nr:hypothetical protein [Massilia timonae]
MSNSVTSLLPLPATSPIVDDAYGRRLVQWIFDKSHELLGPQKPGVEFVNFEWGGSRPHIIVNGQCNLVWIQVSDRVDDDWEAFVAEVSHEAVHVLNPIRGNASYLEEGIAEKFSHHILRELGITVTPTPVEVYVEALRLVEALPCDAFTFAKEVRSNFGALTGVNAAALHQHFPGIDPSLLAKLASSCVTVG